MSKAYTSNLTRDQFELIEPMLPKAKPGGRPRTVCLWAVLNAIFYLVSQGCSWRELPGDFPAWQTVYTYYFLQWAMDTLGWIVQVVLRPREAKGFVLVKKRWIVERTFGWWRWSRRLVQDYEQLPENVEAMLQIAMIRIMLRRLA
jgi:transposase